MADRTAVVRELVQRQEGMLKLRPEYVRRFYRDLNRLGQKRLKTAASQFIPERWIGSSVEALNPKPMPSGGLSMLDGVREPLSLRDAVQAEPELLLGAELAHKHAGEFRVLVKILDPGEPIVFHLHGTDAQVKRMPAHFTGHRFGKDEAYYFLEAPKGPWPYTHAGLHADVTRKELVAAVRKGRDFALELSPAFYQQYGTGFFVPAGVPHSPGTALTLEIQQPSDVYTLMETRAGGKEMSAAQIHPGFPSLEDAIERLVDWKTSKAVGRLEDNRITPDLDATVARVFPIQLCKKFGGDRVSFGGWRYVYGNDRPFVMWVWKGTGTVNGRRFKAGDEFFVAHDVARTGVDFANTGDERFEVFTFFPGD